MRTPDYKGFSKGRCLGGNTGGTCIIGAIWLLSTSLAILLLGGLAWQWRQWWRGHSGNTGCRLRSHRLRRGTRVTVRAHPPEREDAHSFEWTVILSKLTPCYILPLDAARFSRTKMLCGLGPVSGEDATRIWDIGIAGLT